MVWVRGPSQGVLKKSKMEPQSMRRVSEDASDTVSSLSGGAVGQLFG